MAKSLFFCLRTGGKAASGRSNNLAKDYEVAAKHLREIFKVTTTNFAKDPRSKRPILRKILGQRSILRKILGQSD